MTFLAIFLATAACWGIGAIYYSVLSKQWLAAIGKSKDEMGGSNMAFLVSFVAQLVSVLVMYHVFREMGISSIGVGIMGGAGLGLGFSAAWIWVNNAFEAKSMKLSLINSGYAILGLGAAGAILGYFL